MNDTKWMEILDVLRGLVLYYRVKFLDCPKPTYWQRYIQGGFSSDLPTPYIEGPSTPTIVLALEWMEIDPISRQGLIRTNYAQEIEKRLQSVSVPYTWEGEIIRVTGHVRKSVPMGGALS